MTAARSTRTGVLLALSAAFLWGVSGAVAADAFSEVSPARVAETRALITTAVLVPVAWWRGMLNPKGGVGWFFVLGVNLALVNVTFYWPDVFGSVTEVRDVTVNRTLVLRRDDLNADGVVDDSDIDAFNAAFAAGEVTADINRDGQFTVADRRIYGVIHGACGG